ncbi:hypothetical protein HFO06_28630 [Rhizobium leguminosarum]|uniref:hypothetical protein n=1 Tax=Rhizobium leguminosarum TaxID=384 RepID=UPI001C957331|nr:hypothetical protein [Rhizobium leguminosarum]MBY5767018.1 hypothetical protein [Rhizobium leguminosarum]
MIRYQRRLLFPLVAVAVVLSWAMPSRAGMEVNQDREYRRLEDAQGELGQFPDDSETAELISQVNELRLQLDMMGLTPDADPSKIGSIKQRIGDLERRIGIRRKMITQFNSDGGLQRERRFFPDARNRIAVFTYDEAYSIAEIGNAVSFILSKKMLFSSRVRSLGIVNYQDGLSPSGSRDVSYFDKVDRITADQGYLLQLWGQVTSVEGGGIMVDSFLQVPWSPENLSRGLDFNLPKAMGGGRLTARLEANRIRIQSLKLSKDEAGQIRSVADKVAVLRSAPDASAPVTGRIQEDGSNRSYTLVESSGDWVRLAFGEGGGGWTSVEQFCVDTCRRLLDVAAYSNELTAIMAGAETSGRFPDSITPEAKNLGLTMAARGVFKDNPSRALELLQSSPINEKNKSTLGSTDLSNLTALASISSRIRRSQGDQAFDDVQLERGEIANIAEDLARTSVADPRSLSTLENLEVLFGYTGDRERQAVAAEIAKSLK